MRSRDWRVHERGAMFALRKVRTAISRTVSGAADDARRETVAPSAAPAPRFSPRISKTQCGEELLHFAPSRAVCLRTHVCRRSARTRLLSKAGRAIYARRTRAA